MGLITRIYQAAANADMRLERRFFGWQDQVPLRAWGSGTFAGPSVTTSTATGLPAVAAAMRLPSETLAMMPLIIYRGEDPETRERDRDCWQWYRLHDQPNDDQSAFEFWQDAQAAIEAAANAYIFKVFAQRPVRTEDDIQLYLLDPQTVKVRRGTKDDGPGRLGRKLFEVWQNGEKKTYDSSQILHIRGWSVTPGADVAQSPIALHRESLGVTMAASEWEGRFFTNDATPPIVIKVPGNINETQADQIRNLWGEKHGGANRWRPAIVKNDADVIKLGMSPADAQFIDQKNYGLEDICRIFRISAQQLLGVPATRPQPVDDVFHQFLDVDMHPRARRIETALRRDADLFPRSSELFPEFLADAVLRPNIQARYAAYKDGTQGGWLTGNDIRPLEGLPVHPQGDNLQQTPVGGAPNVAIAPPNGKAVDVTANGG